MGSKKAVPGTHEFRKEHSLGLNITQGTFSEKSGIDKFGVPHPPGKYHEQHEHHMRALQKSRETFRWMLQDAEKKTINIGGRARQFQIMKHGINCSRDLVLVTDGVGRTLFFYKSSGQMSNRLGQWLPAKNFVREEENKEFVLGNLRSLTKHNPKLGREIIQRLSTSPEYGELKIKPEDSIEIIESKIPQGWSSGKFFYHLEKYAGHPDIGKISPVAEQIARQISELERTGALSFKQVSTEELSETMKLLANYEIGL